MALLGIGLAGLGDAEQQIVVGTFLRPAPRGAELVEADVGRDPQQERGGRGVLESIPPARQLHEDVVHRVHGLLLVAQELATAAQDHGAIGAVVGVEVERHARLLAVHTRANTGRARKRHLARRKICCGQPLRSLVRCPMDLFNPRQGMGAPELARCAGRACPLHERDACPPRL
jgi:hypothetical protein